MSKILTLGPDGSYSSIITKQLNEELDLEVDYTNKIGEVVNEVAQNVRNCVYGVVPIDNCYGGIVQESINSIHQEREALKVMGITSLKINHCLASSNGEDDIRDIWRVYSHPQALRQCQDFLKDLEIEQVPQNSTSQMAGSLARGEAVICSESSADAHNLKVLSNQVAPENNVTRFAVLGNKSDEQSLDLEENKLIDSNLGLFMFDDFKAFYSIFFNTLVQHDVADTEFVQSLPNQNGEFGGVALLKSKYEGLFKALSLRYDI